MKKYLLKRLLLILPGMIAYIVTGYARFHPEWTEMVYSQSLYPIVSSAIGFLPSLIHVSITEWLTILFSIFCIGSVIFCVQNIRKNKDGRFMAVYRSLAGAAAVLSIVYFIFTALCGLNYHRYTFTSYTGYVVEQYDDAELERLCLNLAAEMERVREVLGEDTDLYTLKPGDFDHYAKHSVGLMQGLAGQYPVLERTFYSAPKPMMMSEFMSYAGIGGVFFPFTLESNINIKAPFFVLPANMTHELAHQCGFMREDEANFIAYLACKQSEDPMAWYSGLFLAFRHSVTALEEADPGRASEIMSGLSETVQKDIMENEQFWDEHESIITDISRHMNDFYLKTNNQADGISSYGRMVDLLLAEQRAAAKQPDHIPETD